MHTEFKIQEIFPSRLANLINKLVLYSRLFIGFANLSGNISSILNSGCINLYLSDFFCGLKKQQQKKQNKKKL